MQGEFPTTPSNSSKGEGQKSLGQVSTHLYSSLKIPIFSLIYRGLISDFMYKKTSSVLNFLKIVALC